jgi:hypothetical protein
MCVLRFYRISSAQTGNCGYFICPRRPAALSSFILILLSLEGTVASKRATGRPLLRSIEANRLPSQCYITQNRVWVRVNNLSFGNDRKIDEIAMLEIRERRILPY